MGESVAYVEINGKAAETRTTRDFVLKFAISFVVANGTFGNVAGPAI